MLSIGEVGEKLEGSQSHYIVILTVAYAEFSILLPDVIF